MKSTLIILFCGLLASASLARASSVMVWSEFNDDQTEINIYFSHEATGNRVIETQISHGGMNITPSLFLQGNVAWLIWVNREDPHHYALQYTVVDINAMQIIEKGTIPTFDQHIYAPSIALSPPNTPWVTWAGFDGNDEEIKVTHFKNDHWLKERNITRNDHPDSGPWFQIVNNEELIIAWKATTPNAVVTMQSSVSLSNATAATNIARQKIAASTNQNENIAMPLKKFDASHQLPKSLKKRKSNILMGSRAQIQ